MISINVEYNNYISSQVIQDVYNDTMTLRMNLSFRNDILNDSHNDRIARNIASISK